MLFVLNLFSSIVLSSLLVFYVFAENFGIPVALLAAVVFFFGQMVCLISVADSGSKAEEIDV